MTGRVLVTPRSLTAGGHPALTPLAEAGYEVVMAPAGQTPNEATLLGLVPGCVGWVAGVEPVSPAVIERADALRVVSRNGVGVDNLPLPALRRRGIEVLTADGANARGVAELAIGLIFAALRHIPATDAGIKAGLWPRLRGRELRGRTVGVIGCGAIGRDVARMVAALGANVVGHDPLRPALGLHPAVFRWAAIPALLAASDVVTLHCPPLPDGRALIDAGALAAMPRDAILVNAARAALVDEAAILAALETGRLTSYATDVFDTEPPSSLALAGHRQVVATSHAGALTAESIERAAGSAVERLLVALARPR